MALRRSGPTGDTLTIRVGTLVQDWARNTAIMVELGGRIVDEGTRKGPVVLTCSQPVRQREPGCWCGLRVAGNAGRAGRRVQPRRHHLARGRRGWRLEVCRDDNPLHARGDGEKGAVAQYLEN